MSACRRCAAAAAVLAVALLGASPSPAARTTTQPGKSVLVYFVISDQRIAYEILRKTAGSTDLILEKYVVRGDFATFFVINRGKKKHGFAFMGKKFLVKPGQKDHFSRALLVRGGFPYRSTTDRGAKFKGVFRVY